MDSIMASIALMDRLTPNCDFVFTGGEPLANLESLGRMMDAIPATHKIFINTSIMCAGFDEERILGFLKAHAERISCLNVSRHLRKYVKECDDSVIDRIRDLGIRVRINCVLFDEGAVQPTDILAFIARWKFHDVSIQFRKDYMKTTLDNLYQKDRIQGILGSILIFDKMVGCRMRNGYFYHDESGKTISYHKTLPFSIIKEPHGQYIYNIVYDVIINQDGSLDADWDGTRLDAEAYSKVIFEDEPSSSATMREIVSNELRGIAA